jgi:hypothetical protein
MFTVMELLAWNDLLRLGACRSPNGPWMTAFSFNQPLRPYNLIGRLWPPAAYRSAPQRSGGAGWDFCKFFRGKRVSPVDGLGLSHLVRRHRRGRFDRAPVGTGEVVAAIGVLLDAEAAFVHEPVMVIAKQ